MLCFLTVLAWYKILTQSLMGEGYYYFDAGFKDDALQYGSIGSFVKSLPHAYDVGAKLLFPFFIVTFRDNIFLYQTFLLASAILINILLYCFVFHLVKRNDISLLASILFATNTVGLEMYAQGNYQWFVQRALALIPLFASAIFFVRFLRQKDRQTQSYVLALFFYCLSFVLFHFSLFVFPLFVMLLVIYGFPKGISWIKLLMRTVQFLPFLFIPILLLPHGYNTSSYMGDNYVTYLWAFTRDRGWELVNALFHQFVILSVPQNVIDVLTGFWNISYRQLASFLGLLTVVAYGFGFFFLYRHKNVEFIKLAIGSIGFIVAVLFLNLVIHWEMSWNVSSGSRYLYIPGIGFSIFWSLVLATVLSKHVNSSKLIIFLMVGAWCFLQIRSIWIAISRNQNEHDVAKLSLTFIKRISQRFSEDSLVVIPNILGYHGANFVQLFYGKAQTYVLPKFALDVGPLPRPFDPKRDFIVDYDYEGKAAKDLTNAYRSIIPKESRGE